MAQHGGKRAGAGRKPGRVSQAKRDLSDLAKDHAEEALATLVDVARNADSAGARVSAAVAILDRAYGKPVMRVEAPDEEAPSLTINIGVREAVGDVRVTKPERAAGDISKGP